VKTAAVALGIVGGAVARKNPTLGGILALIAANEAKKAAPPAPAAPAA